MSKEKQMIEEMSCKKCLHYEMCLENFRKAKEEGLWELTEEDEYFAHADECDFYAAGYRKQSEGEWKSGKTPNGQWGYYCSICSASFVGENAEWIAKEHDYCPKCGAKMKGGEADA